MTALLGPLCSPLALSQANTTNSTVPEGFQLSTERRAKERQEFERDLCEKEALKARMEEESAREREERDKEEVARLRHEQVKSVVPLPEDV